MEPNQQTCLDSSALGEAIDRLANVSGALNLAMPDSFHVRQMKTILPKVVKELKAGFVAATGHNPWEGEPDGL